MPSLEWNRRHWDSGYDWSAEGDEWSWTWGGAESQWIHSLYPRLHRFLPAGTILEIASGHGRWTQFLAPQADHLIGVDLAPSCIAACTARFADQPNLEFHVNDGRSLDMVQDNSIDLAVSFDSLVHADASVIEGYLAALSTKLSPDGVAVLHHSNIGEHARRFAVARRVPPRTRKRLISRGLFDAEHGRDFSMTASRFVELCGKARLRCIGQELVNWGGKRLIDSISVATREGSRHVRPNVVVRNPHFMTEAASARISANVFGYATDVSGRERIS